MNYWSDLFTPETFEAFSRSDQTVTGFRESQRSIAERVRVGDKFVCYMVRLSRWIGILEVLDGPFLDKTPIFVPDDDPFVVRFKVRPTVWLPLEKTIPIHEPEVYSQLSFTREVKPGGYWLGPLRRSLYRLKQDDGAFLDSLLQRVQSEDRTFPVDREQYDRALRRRIQRPDRSVVVTVPDDRGASSEEPAEISTDRESVRVQAALGRIGEAMGFKIWLPNADRSRVAEHWSAQPAL
jgi:hypothetical protein